MLLDRRSLGQRGETLAADYLKRSGYIILQQNYRCRQGEIDIIAKDRDFIVFVEVKTRTSVSHGTPAQSVNRRKQIQIARTAQNYLSEHTLHNSPARFDVIAILVTADGSDQLDHIRNAFEL